MRRGSLASALSSIENLQKIVPNFARALSHQHSRDLNTLSDNEIDCWFSEYTDSSTLPHIGFVRDTSWKSVQEAILCIYRQESLSILERTMLCENMRKIGNSEIGPFVHEFYKEHLVKRAMSILLDDIEIYDTESTQEKLIKTWNVFYRDMLPLLQSIFLDISNKTQVPNIRDVTLLAFRDNVLLKLDNSDILMKSPYSDDNPQAIKQMLLVLQQVKDPGGYYEENHQLEQLVATVINPYLGHCGYYTGHSEPTAKSTANQVIMRKKNNIVKEREDVTLASQSHRLSTLKVPALERVRQEGRASPRQRTKTMSSSLSTENIAEKSSKYSRRHSVQFDLRS